jgi:glutamate---cysteine ligase / carboxylate-amine ligase
LSAGIGAPRFGTEAAFAIGVEEELILVDDETHALRHDAGAVLELMPDDARVGEAKPDTYAAMIELATPVLRDAGESARALSQLRALVRAADATTIGAGIHPESVLGDVIHYDAARYAEIVNQVRGLLSRTPTAALHVHVGMPDAETAIRVCNGLREQLPLLQALAANSPFWFGRDSGLATARAVLFRGFPRSEIPRAFSSYDDYAATVEGVVATGELPDYTYLWWDIRPHPRLGTVEVRAMDSQSDLRSVAGLAALVHGLALAEVDTPRDSDWMAREALMEASFCASRDGLGARVPVDGGLRPVPEAARAAVARARPYADDLGAADALEGIERILAEGNGADRQRAAHARGGVPAMLAGLIDEGLRPYA